MSSLQPISGTFEDVNRPLACRLGPGLCESSSCQVIHPLLQAWERLSWTVNHSEQTVILTERGLYIGQWLTRPEEGRALTGILIERYVSESRESFGISDTQLPGRNPGAALHEPDGAPGAAVRSHDPDHIQHVGLRVR